MVADARVGVDRHRVLVRVVGGQPREHRPRERRVGVAAYDVDGVLPRHQLGSGGVPGEVGRRGPPSGPVRWGGHGSNVHGRVLGVLVTTELQAPAAATDPTGGKEPWPALFALCIGFFAILVDTTIVSVATPAIIEDPTPTSTTSCGVTSAYLLAYAVPVLITGRPATGSGPKNLYLVGLTVFTLASLWCLTASIGMLIAARVVQGLGASMITPQTMAIIGIFPPTGAAPPWPCGARRPGSRPWSAGSSAACWSTASGWEWIFFINVPVRRAGFALAWRLVPSLLTHTHRFDWLGVAPSGTGMFLLVFGIQEGH